jgi:hypothetical protein
MKHPLDKLLYRRCRINADGEYCGKIGTIVGVLNTIHGTAVRVRLKSQDQDFFSIEDGKYVRKWFRDRNVDLVV